MSDNQQRQKTQTTDSRAKKGFSGIFLGCAIVATGVIGFVVGTRSDQLLAVMTGQMNLSVAQDTVDLTDVQQTYRVLKSKFNGELSSDKLVQYASKGLVEASGDPYTEYYTADEAKKLRNDLSGNIGGGIGAELGLRNGKVTVIRPLKDSPAQKAGLQAGDVFIAVNEASVKGRTVDDVVKVVRGEVGSTVKLLVERGAERKEITVERKEIIAPDVESSVQNGIGVIKLSRFDMESAAKVRAAAQDMKRQGVSGVVLDLRGNGGGYLQAGVDIAGVWLNDKVVVSEKGSSDQKREERSGNNAILEGLPTIVLIDAGSASASEIVAGALRDHKAATILGEKSYGKGSVQEMVDLANGDLLKVTIANWYTPAGKSITKEGITPDEKIELTSDDVNQNRDPQLDTALAKLAK